MSLETVIKLMPATLQAPSPAYELQPYKSLENDELTARIQAVREQFGPRLLILGHHYQQDEVIALADLRGDSYGLSQLAAESRDCRYIVFCGVHFMAETADILANRPREAGRARRRARARRSCPTWPPAARWPTWPRSTRSKTPGTSSAK